MAPAARAARASKGQKGNSSHPPSTNSATTNEDTIKELPGDGMSWYLRSWPTQSKAAAVTEVARESISAASSAASQRSRSSSSLRSTAISSRPPSIQLTKGVGISARSLPAEVATTKVNIASTEAPSMPKQNISNNIVRNVHNGLKPSEDTNKVEGEPKEGEAAQETQPSEQNKGSPNAPSETTGGLPQKEIHNEQPRSIGWFEWLSMAKTTNEPAPQPSNSAVVKEADSSTPKVGLEDTCSTAKDDINKHDTSGLKDAQVSQSRSWLQLWGGSNTSSQAKPLESISNPQSAENTTAKSESNPQEERINTSQPEDASDKNEPAEETTHKRGESASGWLFWPRQQADTGSSAKKGEHASENVPPEGNAKEQVKGDSLATETQNIPSSKNSRVKPSTAMPQAATPPEPSSQNVPKEPPLQPANVPAAPSTKKGERTPPNQVLPSFQTSFPLESKPGFIEQLTRLLYKKGSEPRHVLRSQTTPQIKKAIAIGIHGYFPTPLIRTVIGQPTGTSVKFASMAANAIQEWADENNSPCHIEKIALEGEGRISERVDLLWKLLLNWIEHIREADFVLVSCHSQGVPVATMLVSKLIAFGCVSSARIGICAMAGINLGPFADYRSRWISGSAGELFDFTDAESVTYVGSIDDQLVSLESSTFTTVSHPHIYRAVFVDGRVHAPSFLSHLVGFTMKLRNLGVSDHGLIRELSSPLAGSLYTGEGHSRLYEDKDVYKLAIRFALETTVINNAAIQFHKMIAPTASTSTANPYILPFAMRGVLEEEYVRHELSDETMELLKQFEDWKPSTKTLKDVKFRLEGIRSKL
ncbi:hypothetical protein TEQG_04618 [Trichophyton equinum CBS 127.97]|uniref:YMC020W-like alpha/beta hydrolase domain-containing protein n=1 Tax=Trichophyton equinum (strain ATCC MYA-4606 / CBS 127.97) TaxID=559882 RepID=F2PUP1_TRIEC|nr:hypothetical protein TEQG_04618 [Trichophyton equinum CBS 127.97]